MYFLKIQPLYLKMHGSLTKTHRWYSAVLSRAFKTQLALICSRQKPNQSALCPVSPLVCFSSYYFPQQVLLVWFCFSSCKVSL